MRYNAAFINNIADEGSKAEAVEWLQRTWDELQTLRNILIDELGFTHEQLNHMQKGEPSGTQ